MERLGPFSVVGSLSGGTAAELFRVRDAAGRELVAKRHEPGDGERGGLAELVLLGVEHPGLACCLAAGREADGGRLYTVTEAVHGRPLDVHALGTDAVDPERLAAGLLGALAVVHDAGVVHRDLKPDNVLLEAASGSPVILDFGLARGLEEDAPLAGTPTAMAPELFGGGRAGVASDLWAAGLVLAEALLGEPLCPADDLEALARARARPVELPAERVGGARLAHLLERLLDPDPRRRPADARQALAALGRLDADAPTLWGARSACLGRHLPRWIRTRRALAAGEHVVFLQAAAEEGWRAARDELRMALAGGRHGEVPVGDPPGADPAGLAGLARRLSRRVPLRLLVEAPADGTCDRRIAQLSTALEGEPGVRCERLAEPDGPGLGALLEDWLGPQPRLLERLGLGAGGSPSVPSWTAVEALTRDLVVLGAVRREAGALLVDLDRLPAGWPATEGGRRVVDPAVAPWVDLLALAGRPLDRALLESCAPIEPSAPAASDELVPVRSGTERWWALADPGLARERLARIDVPMPVRRKLAAGLWPEPAGAPPDECLAETVGRVLDAPPDAADDPDTTTRLLGAARTLRRCAREGRAAELLQRALDGAAGGSEQRLELERELVDVWIRAGRRDDARARLERAARELGDDPGLALRRARLAALSGDHAGADTDLAALDLDGLGPDDAVLALQLRGGVLRQLGRREEALAVLREACRRHGDRADTRAMVLLERIGLVEHELGHYAEAVRRFEDVADRARALGQDALLWSAVYNVGRSLREKGERRRGLGLQEQAAELAESTGNLRGLTTVLNSLGAGWLALGRLDVALRHLARALELTGVTGDRATRAQVLNNSAHALALEGRLDEAEQAWEDSLTLRRELGARLGQVAVHLVRGEQRLRAGRWDDAAVDVAALDELLSSLEAPVQRRQARLLAARLAERRGDIEGALVLARGLVDAELDDRGRHGLGVRALLTRLGADDLGDLAPDRVDAGPWLAEALAARASQAARSGDLPAALVDLDAALAELGRSPDPDVELDTLFLRLDLDLGRLEATLEAAEPDYGLAGELVERATADLARVRQLATRHGGAPAAERLRSLTARWEAMDSTDESGGHLTQLAGRMAALERLVEINKLLTVERDSQRLLDLIVDSAVELTGAARGFLILFEGQAEEFRAARNIDESTISDPHFQISHSVARSVARSGEPLLTANALDDARLTSAASISELHLLSILCVPMRHRGRVLGAVYLDHPQVVGRFGETHLEVATQLADQAAIAIQNARLSEHLERSNSELIERREEIARLNEALEDRLQRREQELAATRESLDASRRALQLRYDYSSIVSRSPRMLEIFDLLDRVTDTDLPVVIHGESGTGKELMARAIHFNGQRAGANFLSINCAAIAEPLIESELFGSVKGAFTGADRDRKGLFAQADGGTLFLDEIGDMSLDVQKRLLRVLQEGEFLPVGGREVQTADVRILAATHRDLKALVADGGFREDLYFRLAVASVELPALRERAEDIALLLPHFLERHEGGERTIEPEALALLEAQPWPGNVRELENFVQRLLLFERGEDVLAAETVRRVLGLGPGGAAGPGPAAGADETADGASLKERMEAFERAQIRQALERNGGNKAATARELGVPVRSLYKMLERLGLSG